MARFDFECVGARGEPYAETPTLTFAVRITETSGANVHAIALRCQIRIEPHRRGYSPVEAERLTDLFGDRSRWAQTQRPMQMATVSTMVPGFTGATEVDVPVPCGHDLEIASARYLHALDDGTIALLLLYSGSAFLADGSALTVEPVPWSAESRYRMPAAVWRELYASAHALPTWDHTLRALLDTDRPLP